MFHNKDSKNEEIFIKDTVKYIVLDDMGGEISKTGYVIALLSEEMVEVQPDKGGVPLILEAAKVTVIESLSKEVAALASNEDLQSLFAKVEENYEKIVESLGQKGTRKTGARKKTEKKDNPFI